MEITLGLVDSMVLQRGRRGARFSGTCRGEGRVLVRVTRGGKEKGDSPLLPVGPKGAAHKRGQSPFSSSRAAGRAAGGRFEGTLAGLPAGGPYRVELSVVDADGKAVERSTVRNLLVGDVWIAAGQSNMQGCGVARKPLPKLDRVRAFQMDDVWRVARDPIHNMWACVDPVHVELNGGVRPARPAIRNAGVGPAVSFAQEMFRRTKVPQGILACAHGGTSMAQWDPEEKGDKIGDASLSARPLHTRTGLSVREASPILSPILSPFSSGRSLYGATVRRLAKNGGRVAGVIWYQGESDANPGAAAVYTEKMRDLITAFRRDAGDPELPFALVQISRVVSGDFDPAAWNDIQDRQRRLSRAVRRVTTVSAVDLELDDLIHIGGCSQQEQLGPRLAQAMSALLKLPRSGKPPIELDRVSVAPGRRTGLAVVTVRFRNVEGKLRAPGRPSGFALSDPRAVPGLSRTALVGSRAVLETTLTVDQLSGKYLNYGLGLDPYCNVVDSAGRSLPAFSRVPLAKGRALTPFVHVWRRTELLPAPADFASIAPFAGRMRRFESASDFCDLHVEIERVREDRLVYLACRLECPEEMRLVARFGYDGPVKMWVDGREAFADPDGTNPAIVDRAKVPIAPARGTHDVVVALHTHGGRAWGVYLRFERLDVSKRLLRDAPVQVVLPTVVEME